MDDIEVKNDFNGVILAAVEDDIACVVHAGEAIDQQMKSVWVVAQDINNFAYIKQIIYV